jgi:hypothetical protein
VCYWPVQSFLLTFFHKVTKPASIDPDKGFGDRFPCPVLDFSDNSIVTRLDARTSSVSDIFPTLPKGQLHIVVQVKQPGKYAYIVTFFIPPLLISLPYHSITIIGAPRLSLTFHHLRAARHLCLICSFVHYQLSRDHGRSRNSMEMKVKLHLAVYLSH